MFRDRNECHKGRITASLFHQFQLNALNLVFQFNRGYPLFILILDATN